MSSKNDDDIISFYQDLLQIEVDKFRKSQNKDFKSALLTKNDINDIIKKYNKGNNIFLVLLNRKMIIKYDDKYRTAHMDLLAKVAFIRQFISSEPYSLEFDIMLEKEPYPDFGAFTIDKLIHIIDNKLVNDDLSDKERKLIIDIIKKLLEELKITGLSSFQGYIIDKILNTEYNYIPLVAPTATGKTIAFVIPSLVYLLESIFKDEKPINVLFVYPRKALAKDQIEKFIRYLDIINEELAKIDKNKKITIALEDGDTPNEINDGLSYRGLRCPNPKCNGDLVYARNGIRCSKCGKIYDFIIPTKKSIKNSPPNVLITNLWILYRRLLNMNTVNNFKNIKYMVLDEVHAYDGLLYSHLRFILRLLLALKKLTKTTGLEKIIFSSATIPNYREFISKLVCDNIDCLPADILTYNDYYNKNQSKISKQRLILYEFLLPNIGKGVETLTEDVTEAVLAWLKEYNFKGILFADSIAGVTNFYKYFKNTILGERKAREIRDHICYNSPNDLYTNNEYYWPYLSSYRNACNSDVYLEKLAADLEKGIDQHYSVLSLQQRLKTEEEFKNDSSKLMLFSTSTLELGIDIGDIAVIVQHKLPLSRESFIQRVGRAGRSDKTYRIATGIVILQSTPYASLYMFNDELRSTLINMSYNSVSKTLDSNNPQIILQYIFSYVLLKRAINKVKTCVDDGSSFAECENIIEELIDDAENNIANSQSELEEMLSIDLNLIKDDIMDLLSVIKRSINNEDKDEEELCREIANGLNTIFNEIEADINETINYLFEHKIGNIIGYDNRMLLGILNKISGKLKELKEILETGPLNIKIINEILYLINSKSSEIKSLESLLEKTRQKLTKKYDIRTMMKNQHTKKYIDAIINKFNSIIKNIEDLSNIINSIINDISARKCIGNLKYYNNKSNLYVDKSYDIFSIMREKSTNDIFMDLLMTPPSPSIESANVEGDENE
ncbi:DEAD/DEAH box helicase [Sulfurisphaera ohwakuensis]|uniref:DEAD/DEAH box helicase n=1 Tax=Sulfurisphaera ohwakuensis TaxID=69656 RepID=A0A650CFF8_SULOH|nr:DEAD/DEAH box helicase [Sulfurisphaera ohwakuensis]MBB5254131.1 superfamily II DNA/RNA helicase [Sulfurisphaera ohwakuensis]QGR16512.1 DEAD/DEAH box helicase [Sulfurisphaera ohwakuensis]